MTVFRRVGVVGIVALVSAAMVGWLLRMSPRLESKIPVTSVEAPAVEAETEHLEVPNTAPRPRNPFPGTPDLVPAAPTRDDPFQRFAQGFFGSSTSEQLAAMLHELPGTAAQEWILTVTADIPIDEPQRVRTAASLLVALWKDPANAWLLDDVRDEMLRTTNGRVQHLGAAALLLYEYESGVALPNLGDDLEATYYMAADRSAKMHVLSNFAARLDSEENTLRMLEDWFSGGCPDEMVLSAGFEAISNLAGKRGLSEGARTRVTSALVEFCLDVSRTDRELQMALHSLVGLDVEAIDRLHDRLPAGSELRPRLKRLGERHRPPPSKAADG